MRDWWNRSPAIRGRELLLLAAAAAAIAIAQFMPLVLHLSTRIATDLGDPLSQAWQVAWGGHALFSQPLHFWQSNQFWPAPDSLAFSDALVGYAPFGAIGSGVGAAVARYNLLLLFAFSLCLVGAYLLARELGAPAWAAAVGGAAFAWSPWRLWQAGHLHVASSGGVALALFLLLRGYRRGSPRLIFAGWAVAAWQVSIGFTIGLQLLYLLLAVAALAAACWWRNGRPTASRGVLVASLGGVAFLAVVSWLISRPYLRVLDQYPKAGRSLGELYRFSPGLEAFVTAPKQSILWGDLSEAWRPNLKAAQVEQSLYPGIVATLLAGLGLFWAGVPRQLRIGLGLATVGFALLSLGVHPGAARFLPYRFVYELLPGWEAVRTPGRLHTLTTLSLALLASFGASRVVAAVAARRARIAVQAVAVALVLLVLVDGSGVVYPSATVPQAPARISDLPGPILELPARAENNRRYLIWSTDSFTPMVNGKSSFTPPIYKQTLAATRDFPSERSIAYLRRLGVRTVVVYTSEVFAGRVEDRQAVGESWRQAASHRLPSGIGVSRSLRRPVIIYDLGATAMAEQRAASQ